MNEELFSQIKQLILDDFPNLKIKEETFGEETFIVINSKKIYYSEEYMKLIMKIKTEIIWPNYGKDIFFVWEPS